jgi:hypothetical protein
MDSTPVASTTMSNPNGWSSFSLSHWGLGFCLNTGKKPETASDDGYLPVKLYIYVCGFEVLGDIHLDTLVGSDNHFARAIHFQELRQHQTIARVVSSGCKRRYLNYSPSRACTEKQHYSEEPIEETCGIYVDG